MRRIARLLGALVVVLVLAAAVLVAAGWYELRASGRSVRAQYVESLARAWPAFLEDQELARIHPALAPAARERDAGPFLNARIGWDVDPERLAAWRERSAGAHLPLTLDPAIVRQLQEDWVRAPPALWQQLDFSWMAALSAFDHWDVESVSPWAEEPRWTWPNGFPLLHELVPWAKLRLAKGLATRDLSTATGEVEQLGALLLSTETTLGAAVGLQVLELVGEALRAEGPVTRAGGPRGIDAATRARALRATMAAPSFLREEVPEAYRRDVERIVVGRCAALNEALHAALASRGAVDGDGDPVHWIELDGAFARSCRLSRVRRAIAQGAAADDARPAGSCGSAPGAARGLCWLLARVPGAKDVERSVAREILTLMMLATSRPDDWYPTRPGGAR